MRKLLFLLFLVFCAISCEKPTLTPIEKWGGKKYVVVDKIKFSNNQDYLNLKNPDTIFWVRVLKFDSDKVNVGDTIR